MSGNWFAATDGDLEVGRKERSQDGQFQRADWGAAFVRGSRYELPGTAAQDPRALHQHVGEREDRGRLDAPGPSRDSQPLRGGGAAGGP